MERRTFIVYAEVAPTEFVEGAGIRFAHKKEKTKNMKTKQIKLPGPDHPVSIERNPARVVVSVAGRVVADTRNALTLREADYPPVQYVPRKDFDFAQLERTDHTTYCPYKGDCSYYSIPAGGKKAVNAVWSYEDPFPAVAQIRGHVAFYPDRVDEIATRKVRNHRPTMRKNSMNPTKQEKNKALVLDAFETLFNKRDYVTAEKYWSPNYIQHSAHIEPGREGLFNLIRNTPDTNISSSSRRATTSLCTDVSQEPAGLLPGSPRILSESRTAVWPNTGTSCKTK